MDLQQREAFGHKEILHKKEGRSDHQALSTGVVPAEGSSMLKSTNMGYTVILVE